MRKKLYHKSSRKLCALFPLLTLFLGGCVEHSELNERIVVQSVAVDFEDGLYKLATQYYTGESTGGGDQSSAQSTEFTAKGSGSSLDNAIAEATFNSGKTIDFGECQVVVVGKSVQEKGVEEVLKSFCTNYLGSHPRAILLAADGKAEDILGVEYKDETVDMSKIKRIVDSGVKNGELPRTRMFDVAKTSRTGDRSLYLPLLTIEETGANITEDGREVVMIGGVVLKDLKRAGEVDMLSSRGLAIIGGYAKSTTIAVVDGDKILTYGLSSIKCDITPSLEDGQLVFDINVKCNSDYGGQIVTKEAKAREPEVERLINEALVSMLMETAEKALLPSGADILDFARIVRHKDYRLWTKIEDDFSEYLGNAKYVFTADSKINRYNISW